MKPASRSICVMLAIVGISCSASPPAIVQEMSSATGREDRMRILNRMATNEQERKEFFAWMDAHPDGVADTKSKLLAFYSDQTNRTSVRPAHLDVGAGSAPRQTCEGLGYSFSSPWPGFAESEGGEGAWVAFRDAHGRMMMLSKAVAENPVDDLTLRVLPSETNDMAWIQALAFPSIRRNQGMAIYGQCLGTTLDDLSGCHAIEDLFRCHARLAIKMIMLSGMVSPVIGEFRTDDHEGFQIQDSAKPGRFLIYMFDNSGEPIELVFGARKGREPAISQADVNCVLLSLKKIDGAAIGQILPRGDAFPEP